jgi:hypothetical protein
LAEFIHFFLLLQADALLVLQLLLEAGVLSKCFLELSF